MELNTGKCFIFQTGESFNLWGTLWDYMLLLSDWGFGKGEIAFSPLATKPLSLRASNKKPRLESYYFWTELCAYLEVLPCTVSYSIMMWPVMQQRASALLYSCFILVSVHSMPELELGDRVALLGCFSFWNLSWFSLLVLMCHTLSNCADVVAWTSGLSGKCSLFTHTSTLNCRFTSPCEIFSSLLN